MSDAAGTMIIKPCKWAEIQFYESLASHPHIVPFIPTYMGQLTLGQATGALVPPGSLSDQSNSTAPPPFDETSATTATLPIIDHAWAPSNGGKIDTDHAVVLENLTAGFHHPNILDVKLGARLWADDAPAAKRARLDQAAAETTSHSLGFRIAGMKTCVVSSPGESKVYTKDYGRRLTDDTVHHAFRAFFALETKVPYGIRQVINGFIEDLEAMILALQQESSRMYSASLLFVYEGDRSTLEASIAKEFELLDSLKGGSEPVEVRLPSVQVVKLIDFAHASWTPGHGPDENVIHGIRNVVHQLRLVLKS